ncbi:PrsW family glutamic-type intramembrane protease [Scytonema millei]|uniref:PrsW family intramembrane metalloprotease n=1 Tax=Scytonema millei VB511283 TaxID=1245923 RepID=A0A9X5I6L2_9CYAN|nr:PrsW family glutamic-type intramembrane protease [Scytonema millei]NHC37723.1 PrsW family intramembrane metalloprotease [Scytonema millei VB511283]
MVRGARAEWNVFNSEFQIPNSEFIWAVIPPLLLLIYYYRRATASPPLFPLLLCFGWGAIFGGIALGLEWIFEHTISQWEDWQRFTRTLAGVAVRQLVFIAPIEEGCKLAGVVTFRWLVGRSGNRRSPALSIFIETIAIALGFTAQESWVYLSNGVATVFERAIGTPIHSLFSAAFGYALARERFGAGSASVQGALRCRERFGAGSRGATTNYQLPTTNYQLPITNYLRTTHHFLINAIVCHALVNIFSSAWRYNPPLNFLSYLLFPFLLWLFWRMEGWWRQVQHQPSIILISGMTSIHRYWQRGLVVFALMLGGNAIFGFFLLVRTLSPLHPVQLLEPENIWFIASRSALNSIPGAIAWGIYRYLRFAASRRNSS